MIFLLADVGILVIVGDVDWPPFHADGVLNHLGAPQIPIMLCKQVLESYQGLTQFLSLNLAQVRRAFRQVPTWVVLDHANAGGSGLH